MKSLNRDKGAPISDLEAALYAVEKLVKKQIEGGESKGFVLAKGKPNEKRVRWSEVLTSLKSLEDRLGLEGCFSMGVCKSCTKYRPEGCGNPTFGICAQKNKSVHEYSSCGDHSFKGGGWGRGV